MLPYIYLTNVRFWLPAINMRDAMIIIKCHPNNYINQLSGYEQVAKRMLLSA